MFRRFMSIFSILFCTTYANAGQIANVEYVHRTILHRWGVDIAYNEKLNSTNQVANMKYLMTAIDIANRILNGDDTTNYADGDFATQRAVDSVAVDTAIDTLIDIQQPFEITVAKTSCWQTSQPISYRPEYKIPLPFEVKIIISAEGNFTIHWGDGTIEEFVHTDTEPQEHKHTLAASEATIKLYGRATNYNHDETTPTIQFAYSNSASNHVATLKTRGSLGAIFPTLPNGTQPRFVNTFSNWSIMDVSPHLFSGVYGQPVSHMFDGTFSHGWNCNMTTSAQIQNKMFVTIRGQTAPYIFAHTFEQSGFLPFIPDNLFSGISGVPAESMFDRTFMSAFITTQGTVIIPENLFGDISGPIAPNAFHGTFGALYSNSTTYSARINGEFLYNIWPDAPAEYFRSIYFPYIAGGYADNADIPSTWKTRPDW